MQLKWLKNGIIKQNIAIIFISFVLIVATIGRVEKSDNSFQLKIITSVFVVLAIFLTLSEKAQIKYESKSL